MITKLMKDIIGAVFMAIGVGGTILAAVAGTMVYLEDRSDGVIEFIHIKDDKKPKK